MTNSCDPQKELLGQGTLPTPSEVCFCCSDFWCQCLHSQNCAECFCALETVVRDFDGPLCCTFTCWPSFQGSLFPPSVPKTHDWPRAVELFWPLKTCNSRSSSLRRVFSLALHIFLKNTNFQQLRGSQRQNLHNPDVNMIWNTAGSWPSELTKLYVFCVCRYSEKVDSPA